MNARKIILCVFAIILCILGLLLALFELAMIGSEWSLFRSGGWSVFSVFFLIGAAILAGGLLLLKNVLRRH